MAVLAVVLSPLAALEADAAVQTGDARADGPGIAFENTGGNVEIGKGHSESRIVVGDPASAPAVSAPELSAPSARAVNPNADKLAKARAQVDAARARAQAQVDEARRQAEEAVARAKQQAEDARAQSDAQSDEARAQASTAHHDADDSSASASVDD